MENYGLMFELSHPERLKILHGLKKEPMRLSQISKKLDVTTAEVSRHLDRLSKSKMIERDSENYFKLTPFAKIIISQYANFDFLSANMDFFLNHDITFLPEHLYWFDSMKKGQFMSGTLEITSIIKDTSVNSKNYINVISDEVMRGLLEIDCKKIDEGIVFKKIYPKGAEIPKEYTRRFSKNFEVKLLDNIPLALKMNEDIGGVVFRDSSGKMDYSIALIGKDSSFTQWVQAVFNNYWKMASPIL